MRLRVAAATIALGILPAALPAQGVRLGGQLSFAQDENAGLGARLEAPLTPFWSRDVRLAVAFDYFFPSAPLNYWELNGDLEWGLPIRGSRLTVYVGGGLGVAHSSLSGVPGSGVSDLGINLLFGLRIPTGSHVSPFVEVRPELGGGDRLVLTTGLLF